MFSSSQWPVVSSKRALCTPDWSVKLISFLNRVALTFSVVALATIVSVEAVLVSSSETGILISEPTCPNAVPWTAFSFVVPDATTHCPSLTSSLVILPLGNFTSALEAPSDIVTGIVVA